MRSPLNITCFSSPLGSGPKVELSNSMPPEENDARWRLIVPAPAEITHGAAEYGLSDISVAELPAAKTTVMPAAWAAFVAWLMGSSGSKRRNDDPHELLTTRMRHASLCRIMSS